MQPDPVDTDAGDGLPAAAFAKVAFAGRLRTYQSMAVDAFEAARAAGRRRCYLVLPPGAGKTLVGLEIARRIGNRTLVLGPNTAIQQQWLQQWRQFQPQLVEASGAPELHAPVTALTYQAICNLDAHNPDLDAIVAELQAEAGDGPADVAAGPHAAADAARWRSHARMTVARADGHARLLSVLHPNGRRLLQRIASTGPFTLVLDECHHLLEMWGYLLRALVRELGDDVFLVGLTATPPAELGAREAALYGELFGRADLEIVTPAVVKEGDLAPYQELAYLTAPLEQEMRFVEEQSLRFQELVTEVMRPDLGTMPFVMWLRRRALERRTEGGVEVGWGHFEKNHPELALAATRFCVAHGLDAPHGARVGEAERRPLTADDWVALIGDYCTGHLRRSSDAADLEAWEMIRRALPALGYALTAQGIRSYVSPVDRVLLLSGSKGAAAVDILSAEEEALGPRLRALLLCDYEVAGSEFAGRLHGVLDPRAGSAALLLRTLVATGSCAGLDPILVTGRTVACSRATAAMLLPWLAAHAAEHAGAIRAGALFDGAGDWDGIVEITASQGSWTPGVYVPLLTRYFEEGRSRCLIGTRGLLGEGWDARTVNVLVDLTGTTTATAVHQMRGRSLRLDPTLPRKVADNWDVVCVASDHPKGSADYDRFVRKHRNYFAITADGEIESGVSHVDPRLSPFGPPSGDAGETVTREVLRRAGARDHVYDLWDVGGPYRNVPVQTVRIRSERPLGLTRGRPLPGTGRPSTSGRLRARAVLGLLASGGVAAAGSLAGFEMAAGAASALVVVSGSAWAASSVRSRVRSLAPSSALEDLAAAVAEGLRRARLVDEGIGAEAVQVSVQPDGYSRCSVRGASLDDSRTFATALDELLAPIQAPRYVIPRRVRVPPRSLRGSLRLLACELTAMRIGTSVVYHAVPSVFSRRELVEAFERAWNRHVSRGRALYRDDPRAQAIIQAQRGEDPFAVTTQMRILWD